MTTSTTTLRRTCCNCEAVLRQQYLQKQKAALSALYEFTGSKTSQPQRTAKTAGCAAAETLGQLRQTAEFAKGASCASLPLVLGAAFVAMGSKKVFAACSADVRTWAANDRSSAKAEEAQEFAPLHR